MTSRLWAAAGVVLLAGATLVAHHGERAYQGDVTVTLEGTLLETRFADPHTLLQIQGPDGAYTVEWRAASELAAMGVEERMFRPNQYLILTGSPFINPRTKRMSLLTEVYRPEDGFRWRIVDGEVLFDEPRSLFP